LTVPNPVTGSHPAAAVNPIEQHSSDDLKQLFSPEVISLVNPPLLAYTPGFIQPNVGLPAAILTEFTNDTKAAKTDAEAPVPDIRKYLSPIKIR